MNSRDQVCILNDCRYKKNNEQKVQFDKFLYKLEIVPEKWDEAKNIFICLRHLHLMSNKKTDCQKYWLENKSLPNEFVVGNRGVPKTYHLRKYRKLQQKKSQKLSGNTNSKIQTSQTSYNDRFMFVSGFFHPESFISLGISAAAMDDSQLDEEQRAPVQQVPVSRTQSVAAFFAAQTGGAAAAAAAADFFAANNIDAVPVARTQSVDAFSSLPATQLSGALACRCPLSRSLTDKGRAAVLNLLVEISEHHANNHNKVPAVVPFSNYSRLPPTPEADAVSVEVIFCVCFFYNKF